MKVWADGVWADGVWADGVWTGLSSGNPPGPDPDPAPASSTEARAGSVINTSGRTWAGTVTVVPLEAVPEVTSGDYTARGGETITISGTGLANLTAFTYAGISVTPTLQSQTTVRIVVPDPFENGLRFNVSHDIVMTHAGGTITRTNQLVAPSGIAGWRTVSGYDALPAEDESILDNVSFTVVDGDVFVWWNPNNLPNLAVDAAGVLTADAAGDIVLRIGDVSDTTDGPDCTWTVERVYTVTQEEDTTAPILTSALGAAIGSSSLSGSVTTDEAGGLLFWVLTTSATAPTKAQVLNAQSHTGGAPAASGNQFVTSSGLQDIAGPSGLTPETSYYLHFCHQDAGGNASDVLSTAAITTFSTPAISSITVSSDGTTVTVVYNQPMQVGSGGPNGLSLDMTEGTVTLALANGAGTDTWTFNTSRVIGPLETGTAAYSQPGDGIEDVSGVDVASASGLAVTNDSGADVTPPVLQSIAVNSSGTLVTYTFDEAVQFGAGGTDGFTIQGTEGPIDLTAGAAPGNTTLTFIPSRTIYSTEVLTSSFTQFTGGAQDVHGNDLEDFADQPVTNNSTALTPYDTRVQVPVVDVNGNPLPNLSQLNVAVYTSLLESPLRTWDGVEDTDGSGILELDLTGLLLPNPTKLIIAMRTPESAPGADDGELAIGYGVTY